MEEVMTEWVEDSEKARYMATKENYRRSKAVCARWMANHLVQKMVSQPNNDSIKITDIPMAIYGNHIGTLINRKTRWVPIFACGYNDYRFDSLTLSRPTIKSSLNMLGKISDKADKDADKIGEKAGQEYDELFDVLAAK